MTAGQPDVQTLTKTVQRELGVAHFSTDGVDEARAALSTLSRLASEQAETRKALADFDHALSNWERAYPTDVFGEDLTSAEAAEIVAALRAAGFTSERVHASWARHIIRCLTESYAPARAALRAGTSR